MIIGCDLDGVFAQFNEAFAKRIAAVSSRDLIPADADFPCWQWPAHYGYTREEESATWDVVEVDPKFWQHLGAYPDTYEALKLLHTITVERGDDVYFVTSRPGVAAKVQTERWLRCHGFPTPTVLISSAKGQVARALKFDAYVDDRWENAVDVAGHNRIVWETGDMTPRWVSSTTRTYLVDRPWNRTNNETPYGITRVDSALAFVRQLQQ